VTWLGRRLRACTLTLLVPSPLLPPTPPAPCLVGRSRTLPPPSKQAPSLPARPLPPPAPAALCFEGIGFFDVGLAVFTGRLGWLADRVVPCGPKQAARTREEWVALLRRRLQPVARAAAAARGG
jgi:hypothetical protein